MTSPTIHKIYWRHDVDQAGNPLALVIFSNRSFEYVPHSEFRMEGLIAA